MSIGFTTFSPACKLPDAPIFPPRGESLLFRFRRAAEIEHRLLWLEEWLARERPEPGTPEFWRRWTVCVMRLLRLISHNRRLAPWQDSIHAYLRALHEGRPE